MGESSYIELGTDSLPKVFLVRLSNHVPLSMEINHAS